MCYLLFCKILFFQAEDGILDGHVTGVQTCALPISIKKHPENKAHISGLGQLVFTVCLRLKCKVVVYCFISSNNKHLSIIRSEERRVGKEAKVRSSSLQ